jgi:hypothetical protein
VLVYNYRLERNSLVLALYQVDVNEQLVGLLEQSLTHLFHRHF